MSWREGEGMMTGSLDPSDDSDNEEGEEGASVLCQCQPLGADTVG